MSETDWYAQYREALQNAQGLQETVTAQRKRIEELERERKRDCVEFFQWFWNAPGTNAEQGYDTWRASLGEQE